MWLLLLCLGCPKSKPTEWVEPEAVERSPRSLVRDPIQGPESWQGAGLCLSIGADWSGTGGPAPHLLELVHEPTGSIVRLQAWPWGTPVPQPREGFDVVFSPNLKNYRTVPLLTPSRTFTLADDSGTLIQGWLGTVGGRQVVVEHQAPFGRTTVGRDALESLLGSLRSCDAAAAGSR